MTTQDNNNNEEPSADAYDPETLMVTCHHTENEIPFADATVFFRQSGRLYDYYLRDEHGRRTYTYDLPRLVSGASQGEVFFVHSDWECDYGYCNDCSQFVSFEDCVNVSEYDMVMVCENCVDNYGYCEDHDGYYYRYDGCDGCNADNYERDEYGSRLIHDYSYRPEPEFRGWAGGAPTVVLREPRRVSVTGFELEMEATDCSIEDGAELAMQLYGDVCYLKHDGSLNHGFEMVSHPMTLDYIRNGFDSEGLRKLANAGMRSAQTRTCGLHVHINKGFFNGRETSLYRFMSMFYNNPSEWQTLAGRSNSTYADWNQDEKTNLMTHTRTFAHARHRMMCNRYVPVNVNPSHTVELRFFKGTLRPSSLVARLEGVHAVAQYAIETRNNLNIKASHDWARFRQWAEQNGYSAFSEYATTKGV